MKQLSAAFAALLIGTTACSRYEWKNEMDVPGLCLPVGKPVKEIAIPPAPLTVPYDSRQGFEGRIKSDTGEPLGGASVWLIRESRDSSHATTDMEGRFTFNRASPGIRRLVVRRIGFVTRTVSILLSDQVTDRFELSLVQQSTDGPCSGFAMVRVKKPWWKP